MGICICEKHGRAGIIEVCPHAADIVANNSYTCFHRIEVCGALLVCEECLRKYGLGQFEHCPPFVEAEQADDKLIEAYFAIYEQLEGRRVACAECVAAAEVAQARKDGKPDPFPVYERTLTANHREALDQLQAHLSSNFKFEHSVVEPRKEAIFIQGGDYRQPMTVTAYYVTAADEQDRVVSLIADFLAGLELNQAKAVFFEAEVWITWSNPEERTSGGYRGKETLLREIFLNC